MICSRIRCLFNNRLQHGTVASVPLLLLVLLTAHGAAQALAQAPANATASSTPQPAETHPASKSAPGEILLYGTGSYGTLVNLFFLLSALFTDILIIRVFLVLAYIFLTVNIAMNFPDILDWGSNTSPHELVLGTLCWTVITLAVQLWALSILVWDELPVRLSGDDELLWRMFHRRCGMTRKEFQHVLALGSWQQYKAGDVIERRDKDEPRLYVVFKGCLSLASRQHDSQSIPLASGQVANMYLFNLFGIYMGFEQDPDDKTLLLATTDAALFSWDVSALLKISNGDVSIALPAYFRSLALYLVSFDYCRLHLGVPPYCSNGEPEPDAAAWQSGQAMSQDYVAPIGPDEQDRTKLWGAVVHVLRSFKLTVPRGLRHAAYPKTGAMARSRVLLAAHMRQHQQHVPVALAESRAVLAAEGVLHTGSMLSRLHTIAGSTALSVARSSAGSAMGRHRSSSLPSVHVDQPAPMC